MRRWAGIGSVLVCVLALSSACGAPPRGNAAAGSPPSRIVAPSPSPAAGRPVAALWDTYYLAAALDVIGNAREEIDVVQFEFAYGPAVEKIQYALAAAVRRGVKVRVWLDDEPRVSGVSLPHLLDRGIDAALDGSDTRVHTKMILADRRCVLFGSTNFSASSILRNHETDLLVEDPAVGAACAEYAARLRAAPDVSADLAEVRLPGLTVYFDRGFEPALMELLGSASRRIDLQMYGTSLYLDDSSSPSTRAFTALRTAAGRGVKVRVVLERAQDDDFGRETNRRNRETAEYLRAGGCEVRFDRADVISHAKLVIVDETATVGSMNWGFGGFRRYHELNGVVTEERSVADLSRYFETLWEEAGE